jgi:microcystin-dependent protein
MGTPEKEFRLGNIVKAIMDGRDDWYDGLDRDLNVLFASVATLVDCFKASFDAEGNVRTQQPTRELDIITTHQITTDGSSQYPLANRIDTATEIIGFVTNDDTRLFNPTDYTYDSFNLYLTSATPTGTQIEYSIVQNTAGIIDDLKSIMDGLGSYLVGHPDDNNLFQSSTVGDALDEVMTALAALVEDIGSTTNLLKADGTVPLTDNWLVNIRKNNGTAIHATGQIEVTGTPTHQDSFTIYDGNIGLGQTFGLTADVVRASGQLEFTANPAVGDTVTMIDTVGSTITFEFFPLGGPDNSDPSNQGVMLGADSATTDANLRNAITVSPTLAISGEASTAPGNPITIYTQDVPGTTGNTAITVTGAAITKTDFAGGLDEIPAGHLPVVIDADPNVTAANIVEAVNASLLTITAVNPTPPSQFANLTHDVASSNTNIAMEQDFSGGQALTLTGMGGGQSGILGDLCARFRLRNLPPSVRDGDVVVHEQLQGVATSLKSITDKFLPLDGSRPMLGNLAMGNNRVVQMAAALEGTDATILSQVNELIDAAIQEVTVQNPTGTVRMHAGTLIPAGWLVCDGSEVGRLDYPNLWTAIQSAGWGTGDGVNTFNLPDLRGRVPMGTGSAVDLTARAIGEMGGEETHQLTVAELPAHTHEVPNHDSNAVVNNFAEWSPDGGNGGVFSKATGGDAPHNNIQPFTAINFIIKT